MFPFGHGFAPPRCTFRVHSTLALPECWHAALAQLLKRIEDTTTWPAVVNQSLQTLRQPGPKTPTNTRPITVTPLLDRQWAASRWPDLASWQEMWTHLAQIGFRLAEGTGTLKTAIIP